MPLILQPEASEMPVRLVASGGYGDGSSDHELKMSDPDSQGATDENRELVQHRRPMVVDGGQSIRGVFFRTIFW